MASATRSACRIFSDCQVVHASSSLSIESGLSLHMSHGQLRCPARPRSGCPAGCRARTRRWPARSRGATARAGAQDFLRMKAARLRDRRSLVRSRNTLGRPRSTQTTWWPAFAGDARWARPRTDCPRFEQGRCAHCAGCARLVANSGPRAADAGRGRDKDLRVRQGRSLYTDS